MTAVATAAVLSKSDPIGFRLLDGIKSRNLSLDFSGMFSVAAEHGCFAAFYNHNEKSWRAAAVQTAEEERE